MRSINYYPIEREEPPPLSAAQLAAFGVRKLNKYGMVLQCQKCEAVWSPKAGPDGWFPTGFWQCPNRCNL